MDRETILQQFNVIENKISELVDKCHQLETTNAELLNKIELLNSQLEDKLAAERQNEDILNLLVRIHRSALGPSELFRRQALCLPPHYVPRSISRFGRLHN